jgi:hypothetical protein
MKQNDQKSSVMKSAISAVTRTGSWSVAKQDFAHRVTTSGSVANKAASASPKRASPSSLTDQKK